LSILTSDIEFQKISDVNLFVSTIKLILLAGVANTLGQYTTDIPARARMLVSWLAAIDILLIHLSRKTPAGCPTPKFRTSLADGTVLTWQQNDGL
jgi:hypothetical protein